MTKEEADKLDEELAVMHFLDQPGQWVDVTPVDVKKKQAEAWKEFEAMMKNTDRKEVSDNA